MKTFEPWTTECFATNLDTQRLLHLPEIVDPTNYENNVEVYGETQEAKFPDLIQQIKSLNSESVNEDGFHTRPVQTVYPKVNRSAAYSDKGKKDVLLLPSRKFRRNTWSTPSSFDNTQNSTHLDSSYTFNLYYPVFPKSILTTHHMAMTQVRAVNGSLRLDQFETLKRMLLVLILKSGNAKDYIILNFNQMNILAAIYQRKLYTPLSTKNMYLIDELLSGDIELPERRPEESFKFVFKQTYKALRRNFETRNSSLLIGMTKVQVVSAFYAYYFHSVALSEGIPIECYYLPLTSDAKLIEASKRSFKTINGAYIKIVARSPKFLSDFLEYLNKRFIDDYEMSATKKLTKLVDGWRPAYARSAFKFRAVESICEIVINSKKLKIPWFINEVEHAIKVVGGTIHGVLEVNNA